MLNWNHLRKFFCICDEELSLILQAKYLEPLAAQGHTFGGQLYNSNIGTSFCKRGCSGTYTTADLKHTLAFPSLKLSKLWNMVFDKILPTLDLKYQQMFLINQWL